MIVTIGARSVLAIYWVSAIPYYDYERWALNIGLGPDDKAAEMVEGGGTFLPFGLKGA